jgi:TetR/AcrR family fatty acid metabolism transcriptional regulator
MSDIKKQNIISAGNRVFAEKGFQYATISDIARQAGISTGLVYSYFANKLDLLLSVVLEILTEFNDVTGKRLARFSAPLEKIYAYLHSCEELLLQDDAGLCRVKVLHESYTYVMFVKEPALKKKQQDIMQQNAMLIETIDSIIHEGQKAGVFDRDLSPAVMRQVLSGTIDRVVCGLFFKSYFKSDVGYDRAEAHRAIKRVIEKFLRV